MDAHFFRCLAREACPRLIGKRLERISSPWPGMWTIKLGARDFLVFGMVGREPVFFFDSSVPDNPSHPPAQVMGARKRLQGRRITQCVPDWQRRRLHLGFADQEPGFGVCSSRGGLETATTLPAHDELTVSWPRAQELVQDPAIWKRCAAATPALRRKLTVHPEQADFLLDVLHAGACESFVLERNKEVVQVLPALFSFMVKAEPVYASALEAAAVAGRLAVQKHLSTRDESAVQENRSQRKRIKRGLDLIEADRQKALSRVEEGRRAELIKARLHELNGATKTDRLYIADETGGSIELSLDKKLSILENMQRMFLQAAKGKRGLSHIARREAELRQALGRLERGESVEEQARSLPKKTSPKTSATGVAPWKKYVTDDGLVLLRGKNSRANDRLVRERGRPWDLWFHAMNGPGAHVLLLRRHDAQETPEHSLRQAAVIAGLHSHYAGADKAEVLCAKVKDVRKTRHLAQGQVKVERVWRTFVVRLDPEEERRLEEATSVGREE